MAVCAALGRQPVPGIPGDGPVPLPGSLGRVGLAGGRRPARAETETIEARVPRHATLDSLLRDHHFPPSSCKPPSTPPPRCSTPGTCAPTGPTGSCARSTGGCASSSTRSTPIASCGSSTSIESRAGSPRTPQVLPFDKKTRGRWRSAGRSTPTARRSSRRWTRRARRSSSRWRSPTIFSGQIDFDRDLQPGDGFDVLFEKSTRDGEFAGYGADPRRDAWSPTGDEYQAFRWVESGHREGRLLRRGRALAEALLPHVAAASSSRASPRTSRAAVCTRCTTRAARTSASTTARRTARPSSPLRAARSSPRAGRAAAASKSGCGTPAGSRPTTSTSRRSRRASGPGARVDQGRTDRPCRCDRHGDWPAS